MKIFGFVAGPYHTNTFVVVNDGASDAALRPAFVIDPGMHAAARVQELAHEHNLDIQAVVLTHGHVDHSREAGELAAEFTIPVYIHPGDAFFLDGAKGMAEQSRQLFKAEAMLPIADLRDLTGETLQVAGLTFRLHHAPGHTPGCVILEAWVDGRSGGHAFTGDVLFKGSIGRTDFYASDPALMEQSLRGPVWALDDGLTLYPGHGPLTTMAAERATNPFLRGMGEVL